jgi:hypothetical protein
MISMCKEQRKVGQKMVTETQLSFIEKLLEEEEILLCQ